jgi:hypothetical protein
MLCERSHPQAKPQGQLHLLSSPLLQQLTLEDISPKWGFMFKKRKYTDFHVADLVTMAFRIIEVF